MKPVSGLIISIITCPNIFSSLLVGFACSFKKHHLLFSSYLTAVLWIFHCTLFLSLMILLLISHKIKDVGSLHFWEKKSGIKFLYCRYSLYKYLSHQHPDPHNLMHPTSTFFKIIYVEVFLHRLSHSGTTEKEGSEDVVLFDK